MFLLTTVYASPMCGPATMVVKYAFIDAYMELSACLRLFGECTLTLLFRPLPFGDALLTVYFKTYRVMQVDEMCTLKHTKTHIGFL